MDIKKMNYRGKSLDGFEYAFCSLLDASGAGPLPKIAPDCMSFRALAFSFTENLEECFQPAIGWREYMENLGRYLGVRDALTLEGCDVFFMERFPKDTWVMFGEFPHCWGIESIQNKVYRGCPAYYLCRKYSETGYLVCDPIASPVQMVTKEEIQAKMESGCGFVAYFNRIPKLRITSPQNIIADAVEWRKDNPGLWLEKRECLIEKACKSRGSRKYAFSYGLMNYQIQAGKAIEFAGSAGCFGRADHQKLLEMLYRLPTVPKTGSYSVIGELDSAIWEKLINWKRG